MKKYISDGIFIFICVTLFLIGIYMSVKTFTIGTKGEQYEIICIEGYSYHTINFAGKMALAIKLDAEGRPIKCQL